MAPHGEAIVSTTTINNNIKSSSMMITMNNNNNNHLQRTISDISFELMTKEAATAHDLPPISEVEDAKCECCGMSEECTPEYIDRIRSKYLGKWICGLCSEAVKEEMAKHNHNNNNNVDGKKSSGGGLEEALGRHMSACARFNKFGRAYPVLSQAEAMRELLKRSYTRRAKSFSPKSSGGQKVGGGLARSSSCIPAITRDLRGSDSHHNLN